MQQKHFSSLFSVLPSGCLSPMWAGVVELQPCALRVLLLHPQEAVPGWHPALPGLVRRAPLHSLNRGTHPCWRESRVLPTRHPEPWSPAQPPAWEAPAQANPPQQHSDTKQDQGRVAALGWTLLGDSCHVKVTLPSWAALVLCWKCFISHCWHSPGPGVSPLWMYRQPRQGHRAAPSSRS